MIDSKMVADDNINLTELNRIFNEIDPHAPLRDEGGIGVGDSNKLSNNFLKFTDSLLEAVFDEICKKHDIPKYSSQKISQKKL